MEVTNIAPGHYRPRCRNCKELFYIGVPSADAVEDIVVKTLQEIRQEMRASLGIPSKSRQSSHATAVDASATLPVATRLEEDKENLPTLATHGHASSSNGEALQTFTSDEYSLPGVDDPQDDADEEDEPLLSRPSFDQVDAAENSVPTPAEPQTFSETAPQRPTAHDGAMATLATAAVLPEEEDAPPSAPADETMPESLDGYRLIRILGKGAMGAVYLARQRSLDREVAVKTIQAKWAANPVFISRFTREAYAAAQLTHHNIVQIYDMGEDEGVHFFSMELVNGQSLGALLKETGKLDRDVAVGYILQAARGLHFAHQRGIIHRDVKPDNLMVNTQGVVKVADLGLVKLPDVDEQSSSGVDQELLKRRSASSTIVNMSMGTPAYMPPEQARDASSVDHRADIYSLGCTFYALLTGRPPFEGATAMEVISKHLEQPIVRPDAVAKHVPKQLADVTMRMVAKDPDQRAASLTEVIQKLEEYLGMGPTGTFSPGKQHVDMLEAGVAQFNSATAGPLRKSCFLAAAGIVVAVMIGSVIFGMGSAFIAALAMAGATPIAYLVISGVLGGDFLYRKLREFLFSSSLIDWLKYLGGAMLTLLLLAATGTIVAAIGGVILAIAAAAAYYFAVDRTLHHQRRTAMEKLEQLLKSLRLRGLDETEVRSFLVKYAGADWEEVFEELFGYQAKIHARDFLRRSGGSEKNRTFAAWRDPLVRYCDRRISAAKETRERRLLVSIEAKRLQADGATAEEAEAAAALAAQAIIDDAIHQRETAFDPDQADSLDPRQAAAQRRSRMQQLLSEARTARPNSPISVKNLLATPLSFATGAPLRIVVGAALLTGCVMWLHQNQLLSGDLATAALDTERTYQPLDVPLVTVAIAEYVSTFSAGVAGLILVGSAFFGGWRLSLFTWPAALMVLYGAGLGIPDVSEKLHAGFLAGVVGVTLFAIGMILLGDDVED
ncbi:probable protein kinase yloP-putative serine/threonine protein kinase [Blastopirellula marina DSM 3645]|uniref:Probable protein kinase yloP-putative serine/threonine protein kinase n=2 Tax=Blastopirellula marina TaxID=124 RepID=A3ZUI1_9BACT|nr:probable protein kinase yloP-putative serine/threonine protein kinase [Blastopirellula marina DSM 3645]